GAVERALGPAMQNIITNDEQDARKLIDYLRDKQYGRATFLPISSIQPRSLSAQERAALRHPALVGIAAELVGADARYANIVSNLLGRVVIARDMPGAIEMARACRHSLRFVTLQGDIINPGGSMTGGSIQSRYTSLLGREAEIQEVSRRCEALQRDSHDAQAQAAALDEQVDAEKAQLAALDEQLHESALACAREKERLLKARQNEQRLIDALCQNDETLAQLEENLQDILRQQAQAQSQQGTEELNQQSVRDDIVRVQQQVNRQRDEYQQFLQRMNDLKVALAADESRRENLERQIARMRDDARRLRDDAAQKDAAIAASGRQLADEQQALAQNTAAAGSHVARGQQARQELAALEAQRAALRAQRDENARQTNALRAAAAEMRARAGKLELQLVRAEADFENLHNRIWEHYELTYANALPLRRDDYNDAQAAPRIAEIRAEIRRMGTVNVSAVEEYEQLGGRYDDYLRQCADLEKAQNDLLAIIQELSVKMEERFRQQFAKINESFGATFAELFGGGTAQLVLQDEDDILNSGVEIKAQPPGTQLKLLSLLSGGEKALTAIALLFAMLKVNPSPFCVLDEIEAALDDANVRRFAQYLRNFTQHTQFVVVTHRKGTMEACNALYGVTMEDQGISRMLSMKLEDIKEDIQP
ncbi:MAG: hypothetical protein PHO66_01760, partial [Eubacteriales bacterium]|nr:hypothetical protein [Eubacteriales bacterium]